MALRYDLTRFSTKVRITPQGFLEAPAAFTRAGVFTYRRQDGTTIRELRPESEVFSQDSLATLRHAPVVVDHPGMVTAKNARQHTVGWASTEGKREDSRVVGEIVIMDAGTIAKAQARELPEISMGYGCRIDSTSGVDPKYGPYDQIQRDIRYNHVALGPKGWGRAGGEIGIRLDAEDAISDTTLTDDPEAGHTAPVSRTDHDKGDPIVKIKINGVTFDVEPSVAEAVAEERKRLDSLQSDHDKLQGRHDAVAEKLKDAEGKLAEANDPKRFDSAVEARVSLLAQARKVLGDEAEIKGSDREVMEQVLRKDKADLSFEGKSDDYVAARFDSLLEGWDETQADKSKRQAREDSTVTGKNKPKPTEDRYDAKAARQRMRESHADAWKQPLNTSLDRK